MSATTSFALGRWAGYASDYFTGMLDDVRIYNRELTAAEILDIYANRLQVYRYDANGNMTRRGTQTLTWDAENRLVSVHQDGAVRESYVYDGAGVLSRLGRGSPGCASEIVLWRSGKRDEEAVRLAVAARERHAETRYDGLLAKGLPRWEAARRVLGDGR